MRLILEASACLLLVVVVLAQPGHTVTLLEHMRAQAPPLIACSVESGQPITEQDCSVTNDGRSTVSMIYRELALSGSIPTLLSEMTALELIDFTKNLITGTLPRQLTALSRLHTFHAPMNSLRGTVPSAFVANWPKLQKYRLYGNPLLGGTLPDLTGNPELEIIGFGMMPLMTGPLPLLPQSITTFDVNHNSHTGTFPESYTTLPNLYRIDVSGNRDLTGPLPVSDVMTMRSSQNAAWSQFRVSDTGLCFASDSDPAAVSFVKSLCADTGRPCGLPVCSRDCQVTFSDWSACSSSCNDGGVQTRTLLVTVPALGGGAACATTPLTQTCNTDVACPGDCQGTFSSWSPCTATCGGGMQTRTFSETMPARDGGAACVTTPLTQACNEQACTIVGQNGSDDGDARGSETDSSDTGNDDGDNFVVIAIGAASFFLLVLVAVFVRREHVAADTRKKVANVRRLSTSVMKSSGAQMAKRRKSLIECSNASSQGETPSGSFMTPGGSLATPGGSFRSTGGSFTAPGGSFRTPDCSFMVPGGAPNP